MDYRFNPFTGVIEFIKEKCFPFATNKLCGPLCIPENKTLLLGDELCVGDNLICADGDIIFN